MLSPGSSCGHNFINFNCVALVGEGKIFHIAGNKNVIIITPGLCCCSLRSIHNGAFGSVQNDVFVNVICGSDDYLHDLDHTCGLDVWGRLMLLVGACHRFS